MIALAMNLVVQSAEVECRGTLTETGVRQPPVRAFMNRLTVTTTSVTGSRWILWSLEKLIAWARMSFKPTQSRSQVLKRRKVVVPVSHWPEPPSHPDPRRKISSYQHRWEGLPRSLSSAALYGISNQGKQRKRRQHVIPILQNEFEILAEKFILSYPKWLVCKHRSQQRSHCEDLALNVNTVRIVKQQWEKWVWIFGCQSKKWWSEIV